MCFYSIFVGLVHLYTIEQLEIAREMASPDRPIFMIAADVSKELIAKYFQEDSISIIPYKNIDGTHQRLKRLLRDDNKAEQFLEAVNNDKIDLERLVEVFSTNPAQMNGLYPKKGDIVLGADADIVICDMDKPFQIKGENLHTIQKITPYEDIKGWGIHHSILFFRDRQKSRILLKINKNNDRKILKVL